MRRKNYLSIVLCITVLAVVACGNESLKINPDGKNPHKDPLNGDKTQTPPSGILTIKNDYAYNSMKVQLEASFSSNPTEVWFGYCTGTLTKSKVMPENNLWHDEIIMPAQKIGKLDICVTASFKDGSKQTLNGNINVINDPNVNIKQERSSVNGDMLIVWADVPLNNVVYIQPDGKAVPMTKKGNEYVLETKLPEPNQPAGTIKSTDSLGVVSDKPIIASNVDEPRIYYTCESDYEDQNNNALHLAKQRVIESPLDLSYKRTAFTIEFKPDRDENLIAYSKYSAATSFDPDFCGYIRIKSMSKDKKWIVFTVRRGIKLTKNYIEDGKELHDVDAIYTYLYNTQTKKHKLLGSRFSKTYYGFSKESGSVFFPVFVDDKEILMIEQVKNGEMYNLENNKNVNFLDMNQQYINPNATARAMSLSLEDMQIRPTDKVKPLSPWVAFADQCTGIIGYTGPYEKWDYYSNPLPDTWHNTGTTVYCSDLKGTKTINLNAVGQKLKQYSEPGFETLALLNLVSTYKKDGKINLLLHTAFDKYNDNYKREPDERELKAVGKTFRYVFEKDELIELDSSNLSKDDRMNREYYCDFIMSSFSLKNPYIYINLRDQYFISCSVKDDKITRLSPILTTWKDNYSGTFILPGGEQ